MKILMVLTSHDQLGNTGRKTGFWLEEFAAPYFVFRDAGVELTLASPKWTAADRSQERFAGESDSRDDALQAGCGRTEAAIVDGEALRHEIGGLRHHILRGRPRPDVGSCR